MSIAGIDGEGTDRGRRGMDRRDRPGCSHRMQSRCNVHPSLEDGPRSAYRPQPLGSFAQMALVNQAQNILVTGSDPIRMGHAHPNLVPYRAFESSDGWLIIAVGSDPQFERLDTLLGTDLVQKPSLRKNGACPEPNPRRRHAGGCPAYPDTGDGSRHCKPSACPVPPFRP